MSQNNLTFPIIFIVICAVVFGGIYYFGSKGTTVKEETQPVAQNALQDNQTNTQQMSTAEKNLQEGQAFLAQNKTKPGVVTTASGLQYEVLKEGTGPKPTLNQTVKVHYEGTLIDGTIFDSSYKRGEPIEFGVTQVIPGWTEALQLMNVGSKYKLYLPSNIAYGANGAGGAIGPNETLIFTVELLAVR